MSWRQDVWGTLPTGCLTIEVSLWGSVSLREARARSVVGGKIPPTAWQSSVRDGSGHTSVVSARPRAASRGYERSCPRQQGWLRLSFLLCQRGRLLPSRVRSWDLLRAPHATPRCAARPPQTHDRLFSRYRLCTVLGTRLPASAPGMVRRRPAARAYLQPPAAAHRAGPWTYGPLNQDSATHRPAGTHRGWGGPRPQGTSAQGAAAASRTEARPAPTVGPLLPHARLLPGCSRRHAAVRRSRKEGRPSSPRALPVRAQHHQRPARPLASQRELGVALARDLRLPCPLMATPPADAGARCGRHVHEDAGRGWCRAHRRTAWPGNGRHASASPLRPRSPPAGITPDTAWPTRARRQCVAGCLGRIHTGVTQAVVRPGETPSKATQGVQGGRTDDHIPPVEGTGCCCKELGVEPSYTRPGGPSAKQPTPIEAGGRRFRSPLALTGAEE
jgi:hypothetical protein